MPDLQSLSDSFSASPALRAMFEARKRVFVDLLKWDVPVLAGRFEIDQFDTDTATYLVMTDETGAHRGSTRLLPTDGPHILGDLFATLCSEPLPRSGRIYEITRFCIEPTLSRRERRLARNQLVTALVEHALSTGIERYTAVATAAWYRQIEQFGWTCRLLGRRSRQGAKLWSRSKFKSTQTPPHDWSRPAFMMLAETRCPTSSEAGHEQRHSWPMENCSRSGGLLYHSRAPA